MPADVCGHGGEVSTGGRVTRRAGLPAFGYYSRKIGCFSSYCTCLTGSGMLMPGLCLTSSTKWSTGSAMCVLVLFRTVWDLSPAGVPSGKCGGPGSPIGVPEIVLPHEGAT